MPRPTRDLTPRLSPDSLPPDSRPANTTRRHALQTLGLALVTPLLGAGLSACGFRLRGSTDNSSMRGMVLQVQANFDTDTLAELQRQWTRAGGRWLAPTARRDQAPESADTAAGQPGERFMVLKINEWSYRRVAVATSTANLVREYELQLRLEFQVLGPLRTLAASHSGDAPATAPSSPTPPPAEGQPQVGAWAENSGPQSFTLRQLMSYDENQALAKEYEEAQLRRNLERDAARRIVFYIEARSRAQKAAK